MRRIFSLLTLGLLVVLLSPGIAQAGDFRAGDAITIGPNETIESDLYLSAASVRILGTVRGDIFAVGATIDIAGTVDGGVSAAGQSVSISGQVTRGVRAAGATVTVSGRIGRDLLAFAGTATVAEGAQVGGDLVAYVGVLAMNGSVGGSIFGSAGQATVNGPVTSNVNLDVGTLTIGAGARIGGSLSYRSDNDARIDRGAQIADNRGRTAPPTTTRPTPNPIEAAADIIWGFVWNIIRGFLGLAVLGLLWLWLFPRTVEPVRRTLHEAPLPSLGLGIVALLLTPAVLLLLVVLSIVAGLVQLTVVTASLLAAALALSGVIVGFWLGDLIVDRLGWPVRAAGAMLLGAALVAIGTSIPILGWFVSLAIIAFGLGTILLAIIRARRASPPEPALA
jgi:hypothetical protein